jgi:hypothetical protein
MNDLYPGALYASYIGDSWVRRFEATATMPRVPGRLVFDRRIPRVRVDV